MRGFSGLAVAGFLCAVMTVVDVQPAAAGTLILQGGRFYIDLEGRDPNGESIFSTAVSLSDDSGYFWFFGSSNVEMIVKVLDGRSANGHFWVFYGSLSDIPLTLTVRDVVGGEVEHYYLPGSVLSADSDIWHFPLPKAASAPAAGASGAAAAPAAAERSASTAAADAPSPSPSLADLRAAAAEAAPTAAAPSSSDLPAAAAEAVPAAAASSAEPVHLLGDEFLPSADQDYTSHAQVASDAAGNFTVIWAGNELANPFNLLTFGRRFGPSGQPLGDPFVVAARRDIPDHNGFFVPASSPQDIPARIAVDPTAGNCVVVWTDDRVADGIFARLYDRKGVLRKGTFQVNEPTSLPIVSPAVAFVEDLGGFIVAWSSATQALGTPNVVMARLFDAGGLPLGPAFQVSTTAGVDAVGSHIGVLPGGSFVIAWTEQRGGLGGDIWARLYDYVGHPRAPAFQVSPPRPDFSRAPQWGALPLVQAGGTFSIIWSIMSAPSEPIPTGGIFAQRFDRAGSRIGAPVVLKDSPVFTAFGLGQQVETAAAVDPSGNALLVFPSVSLSAPSSLIVAGRVFAPAWEPLSPEVQLSSSVYSLYSRNAPSLAVDAQGRFTAVWTRLPIPRVFFPFQQSRSTPAAREAAVEPFFPVLARRLALSCVPETAAACAAGRFQIRVAWNLPDGRSGAGQAVPLTANSAGFWFFDPTNVELVVKILDGRAVNGSFWVFYVGLSSVDFTITITDTQTLATRTYHHPESQPGGSADTSAF